MERTNEREIKRERERERRREREREGHIKIFFVIIFHDFFIDMLSNEKKT